MRAAPGRSLPSFLLRYFSSTPESVFSPPSAPLPSHLLMELAGAPSTSRSRPPAPESQLVFGGTTSAPHPPLPALLSLQWFYSADRNCRLSVVQGQWRSCGQGSSRYEPIEAATATARDLTAPSNLLANGHVRSAADGDVSARNLSARLQCVRDHWAKRSARSRTGRNVHVLPAKQTESGA